MDMGDTYGTLQSLSNKAAALIEADKLADAENLILQAEKLAADLAGRGLVIVSGMARGIDSISHWGALKAGKTVAVLGTGLDVVFVSGIRSMFPPS